MSTFKEMRARAQRNRRTVPVCMRGDLAERFERLERELADAERRELTSSEANSLEHEPESLRIAREIEAVRTEMQEDTYTWVLQALPGKSYRALKAAHPPREKDDGEIVDEDRILDANYDTFLEPLLRASVVDPVFDDDADFEETVGDLSEGFYTALLNAAYGVNKGGPEIPFSHAASRRLGSTGNE
jgi:hypothetical protein